MNTASPLSNSSNQAAWALWVSPTTSEMRQLRNANPEEKQRTLLLHPKNWSLAVSAIETAIETGFYETIRLPKDRFHSLQQQKLELVALRNGVTLNWASNLKNLNSSSQMSLL